MSFYDYLTALEFSKEDPPFYSLIMAAMLKADSENIEKLKAMWPEVHEELKQRYHSRLIIDGKSGALENDI